MRELVVTARGRGAGRLVAWGGVAVVAFTAAFASWQYSPVRSVAGDAALATASIPTPAMTTTGGAVTPPTARQVGRGITNVPGVSDFSLVQRDIADLRQDLADLRRGLSRYDLANEQTGRRLEALEDQAAILASRLAQALDGPKPLPPGTPAAAMVAPVANSAPQAVASTPTPPTKPGMAKLEPALFDNRIGKVAPRPLVPETPAETKVAETIKTVEAKPVEVKPVEAKAPEAKPPVREAKVAPADAEPEAAPSEPAKPAAKEAAPTVKAAEPTAATAAPAVATAPVPVPPPSTPPITATVRPPPTPAEEAQRAQRAAQAAQVQQLAQQMILSQPGGKGLQLPLPANAQLAAAAAAAKADAKRDAAPDTTGTVPAADDATKTAFAVDLGGYKSLANLRKGWATTSAKHAGLTKGLTPLGQMKENGGAVEARLVAGPFAKAADAVKFCAQVQSAGTACAPSVYVGQPLNP